MRRNRIQALLLFAVGFTVACAGAFGPPEAFSPRRVELTGTYVHPGTSLEYPERIGVFRRLFVTEYDPDGYDSSGHYASPESLLITARVYHYPATVDVTPPTSDEFVDHYAQVLADITSSTAGGKLIGTEWEPREINSFELNGLHSIFEFEEFGTYHAPVRSHVYLYVLDGWYLKFRFTHPADIDVGATEHEVKLIESIRWPRPDSQPAI